MIFKVSNKFTKYKKRLGMQYANYNHNVGVLWYIQSNNYHYNCNSKRLDNLYSPHLICLCQVWWTSMWHDIYNLGINMNFPWLVERDFNVILRLASRIWGLCFLCQLMWSILQAFHLLGGTKGQTVHWTCWLFNQAFLVLKWPGKGWTLPFHFVSTFLY